MTSLALKASLRSRLLSAGGWSIGGHFVAQGLRFGGSLIMTRLLVPDLIGVMAIAMTFLVALNMFLDFGLRQAVVRHPVDQDETFLNAVWTVNILRCSAITILIVVLAWCIYVLQDSSIISKGTAYAHKSLPIALLIIAAVPFFNGLESTKTYSAGRRLALKRLTLIDLLAQIVGLALTIMWAMASPTIHAVAWGAVASTAVKSLLSHIALPGERNRLEFSKRQFKEIISFGKWLFLTSTLGFFVLFGDRLLLGGMLEAGRFGVYTVAVLLIGPFLELAERLIGSVLFPALSEMHRKDSNSLRQAFYRFRRLIDPPTWFIAGLLFTSGSRIVELVFDHRYEEAGFLLQILSLSAITVGIGLSSQIYMIIGKPWLLALTSLSRLLGLYIFTPIFVHAFGLTGGALGVLTGYFISLPVMYFINNRLHITNWKREFIGVPFLCLGSLCGYLFSLAAR